MSMYDNIELTCDIVLIIVQSSSRYFLFSFVSETAMGIQMNAQETGESEYVKAVGE